MRHFITILLLICNIAGYGQVHEGLEIRKYPWRMRALNYPRTPDGDSVVVAKYNEVWYFNLDSLCYHMVADRRSVYTEDLVHYYYWEILDYASAKQVEEGYRKIKDAAKKYNSALLNYEADYMKIHGLFYSKLFSGGGVTEEEMENAVQEMHKYIDRLVFKNDKARYLEYLAESYHMYRDFGNYAKMFKYIPPIVDLLKQITPEEYINYHYIYYHIGSDYYNFRDYERAVFFLKKALHSPPTHFADRSDLRARFLLAEYYAEINQLDSSDFYYRSIYDDTNMVRFRPSYDAMAAVGIANNLIRRNMHRKAMPILKRWLPEAFKECLRKSIFDACIALCECHLAEKQYPQAKVMIDSVNALIRQYPDLYFRKKKLFEQMFRYNLNVGQTDLAYQYVDSMQWAHDIHEKKTNSLIILRAEQELHEAEIAMKNEQEQKLKNRLQMSFAIIILIMLALFVIAYFYRQKRQTLNDLVHKNLQWANQNYFEIINRTEENFGDDSDSDRLVPTDEDNEIVKLVHEFMLDGAFKGHELTLDILAKKLNINRNNLSHAINAVTGKNFNNFINEYRIKEALRIISKHQNLYIDELYGMVGFRSRTSFYRSFKQITGLSPREFTKVK
ncbi:MAG: helix-turn-helix domain-containing protein, partial [Prevotellaceae bacterium]|nr:helix-turn-helix domain-containing protein [Prevotellaceae bacterium]